VVEEFVWEEGKSIDLRRKKERFEISGRRVESKRSYLVSYLMITSYLDSSL